ncbi:hypothetical protein C7271_18730 [filamentous cyanobacterium CCP5]|nr:hypothetical protein C7271_18730 [filamentous cyanobacterium CCP5]
MNIEQALLKQVRTLTLAQQQAVLDFAASLHPKTSPTPKERIPGLHRGALMMSNDFDDSLPDSFWLVEEE